MSRSGLPEPVRRLIVERLESASELEIVVLLQRSGERSWTARDVNAELKIGEPSAARCLERLEEQRLLASNGEEYRLAPATPALEDAVALLADAYAHRRVRVIELLYQKPSDRITLFSDAFRIRRERE